MLLKIKHFGPNDPFLLLPQWVALAAIGKRIFSLEINIFSLVFFFSFYLYSDGGYYCVYIYYRSIREYAERIWKIKPITPED